MSICSYMVFNGGNLLESPNHKPHHQNEGEILLSSSLSEPGHICRDSFLQGEVENKIIENLGRGQEILDISEFFKIMADPTRLKILICLMSGEISVCDIARLTGMSHSAVSHQLRLLRANRLVSFRREGRMIFYSIKDYHIETLLQYATEHLKERD